MKRWIIPCCAFSLLLAGAVSPIWGAEPIPAPDDVAAPPEDASRSDTGLASKVLTAGAGDLHPETKDSVRIHYTGWTADGKMIDSSVARNLPAVVKLDRVIPGWAEGVKLMVAGEKRRLWIPEDMAYQGRPDRPAGMLVFDIELLEVLRAPPPPADVAGPPPEAERTKSGLAFVVLHPGTGTRRPKGGSREVEVHYTGWTTDGKMFDSSITRGKPAVFPLNRVISGWTEGLKLMVEGEKRRFWIPEKLAYKGKPGVPAGMLVFDVELISIKK